MVPDSCAQSIDKLPFIHMRTEISSIAHGSFPVLAVHEDLKKHNSLLTLAHVEDREPMLLGQQSVVPQISHELVDGHAFIIIVRKVCFWVEGITISLQLGISQGIKDFVEEEVDVVLLLG